MLGRYVMQDLDLCLTGRLLFAEAGLLLCFVHHDIFGYISSTAGAEAGPGTKGGKGIKKAAVKRRYDSDQDSANDSAAVEATVSKGRCKGFRPAAIAGSL